MAQNQVAIGQELTDDELNNLNPQIGDTISDEDFAKLSTPAQPVSTKDISSPEEMMNEGDLYKESKDFYTAIRPYAQPTTEGVAMGAGALVGAPGGPAGSAFGAATGYAVSKEMFDLLDKFFGLQETGTSIEELKKGVENVKKGVEYGVGGEILGAALPIAGKQVARPFKWAFNKAAKFIENFPMRGKSIEGKAAQVLEEAISSLDPAQVQKDMGIAAEIEKQIPGVKFNLGQITNSRQLIGLQQKLVNAGVKVNENGLDITGSALDQTQKDFLERAIQRYYTKELLKEGETAAFQKVVESQAKGLEETAGVSQEAIGTEVNRLERAFTDEKVGGVLSEQLNTQKDATYKQAQDLYSKVGNPKLPVKDMWKDIKKFTKQEYGLLRKPVKNMLAALRQVTTKADEEGKRQLVDTDFTALRKLYSDIGEEWGIATRGINADRKAARQLTELQNIVSKTMDKVEAISPETKASYEEATNFYRDEYIDKFFKRTPAEILQKGTRGEESKIALSNVAGKFFTKDKIHDFFRTLGNNEAATEAMRDYGRYSLYNKAYNVGKDKFDVTKAANWISDNKEVIDKLGLTKEFNEIIKKGTVADADQAALATFNKSVAGRVLGASPDRIVEQAFRGSTNYKETAKELLALARKGRSIGKETIESLSKEFDVRPMGKMEDLELFGHRPGGGKETTIAVKGEVTRQKLLNAINKSNEKFGFSPVESISGEEITAAEAGIKKAVADHILKSSFRSVESRSTDYVVLASKLNATWEKFKPALTELYKDEPEKLKALVDANQAFRIASRTKGQVVGTGAEAYDQVANTITGFAASRAAKFYFWVSIRKALTKHSIAKLNQYLLKASFDPEYAMNLVEMRRATNLKKAVPKTTINVFNKLVSRLSPLVVGESNEKEPNYSVEQ